jgi:hypothetical protein
VPSHIELNVQTIGMLILTLESIGTLLRAEFLSASSNASAPNYVSAGLSWTRTSS